MRRRAPRPGDLGDAHNYSPFMILDSDAHVSDGHGDPASLDGGHGAAPSVSIRSTAQHSNGPWIVSGRRIFGSALRHMMKGPDGCSITGCASDRPDRQPS